MKRFLTLILVFGILSTTQAGVLDGPKFVARKVVAFGRHPQTLKWGFYACMVGWGVADALRDSDVHKDHYLSPDHTKYLTGDGRLWHGFKNADRLLSLMAGGALAGAYFQDYISFTAMLNRLLNGACISYLPWRAFYLKNKFNRWYIRDAVYNKHLLPYVNPFKFPWKDEYVGLSGWQVDAFYGTITTVGVTRMLFFDHANGKPR